MNQPSETRRARKTLLCDERGAVAIILILYLPVIVGFFTLAVDMSYVLWTRNMLQVTAESAALAASSQLPDPTTSCAAAKSYATKNMPFTGTSYGYVLKQNSHDCSDVVLGRWSQTCQPGQNCFVKAGTQGTPASCATSPQCNAVQVTTQQSTANGNPLNLVFAPFIGLADFNVSATAIAALGPGPGSKTTWNAVIVEDISSSFSKQLTNARAADLALLNCMRDNAAAGSKLGVTLFTGVSPSPPYQGQLSVSDTTNYNNLKNKIAGINQCGSSGMPACSGSNVAVGMSSAITQICPPQSCTSTSSTGPRQAMVIVTDGIPNCGSTKNCTDNTLLNNAVNAANTAANDGIDIFTIYYGTSNSDAAWLATLVRGNGLALKTPDPTKLSSLMQQICASSLAHRLVW